MNAADLCITAMYLPQYHEIAENNQFWGKGFTDWTTVKSAKKYCKYHHQPKVPLDENYYDLSDEKNIAWQANLAYENGIDAFCFYHYWFSSKRNILTKPAELYLKNKSLPLKYCFGWDNAPWKRSWSTQYGNAWTPIMDSKVDHDGREILLDFEYEDETAWKKHFEWLSPFFEDSRYLKIDNKPVFLILNYYKTDILRKMIRYWNKIALGSGFSGMYIIGRFSGKNEGLFNADFLYQPIYSGFQRASLLKKADNGLKLFSKKLPLVYDYQATWKNIIRQSEKLGKKDVFYGAFVNYDDTPRRGEKGKLYKNVDISLFRKYFKQLLSLSVKYNKKLVFLTAWNEWGEGAYLEPDTESGDSFLKAVRETKFQL